MFGMTREMLLFLVGSNIYSLNIIIWNVFMMFDSIFIIGYNTDH